MSRQKIGDDILIERVRNIISILDDADSWVGSETLSYMTGLSIGQIKAAVKFNRRWFINHPTQCGNKYIISGKAGYRLPKTDEDYILMYKSLYAWGKSILITLSPVGKYLQDKGHDMAQIRKEATETISDYVQLSVGGAESWQE